MHTSAIFITSQTIRYFTAMELCSCTDFVIPVLDSLPVLLLLPELSPLVRTEIPLKLLAFVTAGFRLRMELSESVLLQGRGSQYFSSFSVLL